MPSAALPFVVVDLLPARPTLLPGWTAVDGLELPTRPWDLSPRRLVCVGVVDDDRSAASALAALPRGVRLIIQVDLDGQAKHRFLEDLHTVGSSAEGAEASMLDPRQQALLEALRSGATMNDAAGMLHLSRRSAYRMLAAIQEVLGVATAAEAVSWWARRPSR